MILECAEAVRSAVYNELYSFLVSSAVRLAQRTDESHKHELAPGDDDDCTFVYSLRSTVTSYRLVAVVRASSFG
jgi:hypothetical protein